MNPTRSSECSQDSQISVRGCWEGKRSNQCKHVNLVQGHLRPCVSTSHRTSGSVDTCIDQRGGSWGDVEWSGCSSRFSGHLLVSRAWPMHRRFNFCLKWTHLLLLSCGQPSSPVTGMIHQAVVTGPVRIGPEWLPSVSPLSPGLPAWLTLLLQCWLTITVVQIQTTPFLCPTHVSSFLFLKSWASRTFLDRLHTSFWNQSSS